MTVFLNGSRRRLVAMGLLLSLASPLVFGRGTRVSPIHISPAGPKVRTPSHEAQRLLLVPYAGINETARDDFHQKHGVVVRRRFPRFGDLEVVEMSGREPLSEMTARYKASGLYEIVEPDYVIRASVEPNDPRFISEDLWHLQNIGQSGGREDADIDAPEAWEYNLGAPSVIVAVIDSGIRRTHQDLIANLWTNENEIAGNGLDDDFDGYIDDVHGINAIEGTGDPNDDNGHGTHVAGILAARGNNALGVVGVAWEAQIMALKFLDADGNGSTSDAISCINYAVAHGAKVINASWGGPDRSRAFERALNQLASAGVVFVAAAGNDGVDLATTLFYPAAFKAGGMITVAATTRTDALASYSNYGATEVDVAAPGSAIWSCWNSSDASYVQASGTSMATPIVAGIVAHLRYLMPGASVAEIIDLVKTTTDPLPALAGKTVSGGRVNLWQALKGTGYFEPVYYQIDLPVSEASDGVGARPLRCAGSELPARNLH